MNAIEGPAKIPRNLSGCSSRGRVAPCLARVDTGETGIGIGPHASNRAGGIVVRTPEETARAGAARVEAVALDLRREQHRRLPAQAHCGRRSSMPMLTPAPTTLSSTSPPRRPPTSTSRLLASIRSRRTGRSRSTAPCRRSQSSLDRRLHPGRSGGVPFRYPDAFSSAVQSIAVTGSPTGGTFRLDSTIPGTVGTAFVTCNATAATVQVRWTRFWVRQLCGLWRTGTRFSLHDHVSERSRGPGDSGSVGYRNNLTGGTNPGVLVQTTTVGGLATADPM